MSSALGDSLLAVCCRSGVSQSAWDSILACVCACVRAGGCACWRCASLLPRHSAELASFVEELVVRRELSDNFCLYNAHYDSLAGAADWAKTTLNLHKKVGVGHIV